MGMEVRHNKRLSSIFLIKSFYSPDCIISICWFKFGRGNHIIRLILHLSPKPSITHEAPCSIAGKAVHALKISREIKQGFWNFLDDSKENNRALTIFTVYNEKDLSCNKKVSWVGTYVVICQKHRQKNSWLTDQPLFAHQHSWHAWLPPPPRRRLPLQSPDCRSRRSTKSHG